MTKLKSIALAAWLACAPSVALAGDYTQGAITVANPWARATPKGAPVAGGYLTIINKGTSPDRLVAGSVPFAGRFEVHEMKTEQGVMRMRPVAGGLEIKPGETVELKPGGLHVMFLDLKQPLQAGQPQKGTLVFEKAGTVEVEFTVAPIGAPAPPGAAHTGH